MKNKNSTRPGNPKNHSELHTRTNLHAHFFHLGQKSAREFGVDGDSGVSSTSSDWHDALAGHHALQKKDG